VKKQVAALLLGIGLIGAAAVMPASAQENNPGQGGQGQGQGQGGDRGGRGGRGNFDPAQWRQQREEQMKKDMGATDEEWKALQPRIQKVQQIQFASRFGGFGGRRGGGGGGGGDRGGDNNAAGAAAQQPSNPVSTASRELRETLDNKDSTPEQIKAKLDALRQARVKAKEELTKAQTELREIASVRQEAVLVRDGILD
jgi:Spy/CpxP family protein refolding chaperone